MLATSSNAFFPSFRPIAAKAVLAEGLRAGDVRSLVAVPHAQHAIVRHLDEVYDELDQAIARANW